MNQIIQNSFYENEYNHSKNASKKFRIEFSNEIAEIPYGGNFTVSTSKLRPLKNFFRNSSNNKKYQLQFFISASIAIVFLICLFWKLYQNQQQEKIAKDLLNNYQLSTLYSNNQQYEAKPTVTVENPFVIGMIKIDKIELNYPILSESTDELLKISLCRFTGPLPNEIGNLCIAGHNYIDNRFFSRLDELQNGDKIEVYGVSGQKQEYHVFKKYEVDANDLSCTNQDIGENKMITLLTCNNSNSKKRIVIQAK